MELNLHENRTAFKISLRPFNTSLHFKPLSRTYNTKSMNFFSLRSIGLFLSRIVDMHLAT